MTNCYFDWCLCSTLFIKRLFPMGWFQQNSGSILLSGTHIALCSPFIPLLLLNIKQLSILFAYAAVTFFPMHHPWDPSMWVVTPIKYALLVFLSHSCSRSPPFFHSTALGVVVLSHFSVFLPLLVSGCVLSPQHRDDLLLTPIVSHFTLLNSLNTLDSSCVDFICVVSSIPRLWFPGLKEMKSHVKCTTHRE